MAVIRDRGAKKSIFKLKPARWRKKGILFGKDLFFFNSHYLRLLLFISRNSVQGFKTGLPVGQLIRFNLNSATWGVAGMLESIPAGCLRAKAGLHPGQSVRPTGHTERQTTSCTHTEKQFRFLCCDTRSTYVWTVRTQADTGRHRQQGSKAAALLLNCQVFMLK